jgi:hypothetical protein
VTRSENPRRRASGFTLLEVGVLLLFVAVGGYFIWNRMQAAKETSVRAAAKAQLEEFGVTFTSAEELEANFRNPYTGPMICSTPFLQDDRRLSRDQIDLIAFFPETKSLVLVWQYLEDDDLARLKHFKQLEDLSLEGSLITDDGMAVLKSFPNLRTLNLSYCLIKGPGLEHLRSLPRLEKLSLLNNELTDDCVSTLLELKSLKEISLDRTFVSARLHELTERGIEFDSYPFQTSFEVAPDPAESAWLSPFSGGDHHTAPTLGTDATMESTIAGWQTVRKLAVAADSQIEMLLPPDGRVTCLRVRGAKMLDKHFQALTQMPALRSLDLAVSRFPMDSFSHLDSLHDLRRIDLSRTTAKLNLASKSEWLQRIESLHLRSAGLVDDDLNSLWYQCPNLRILDLSRNRLTDDALPWLLKCGRLEELSLAQTGVTGDGILQLRSLENLRRLDLRGMAITEKQLAALKKERPQLRICWTHRSAER